MRNTRGLEYFPQQAVTKQQRENQNASFGRIHSSPTVRYFTDAFVIPTLSLLPVSPTRRGSLPFSR
jgi:hypothetical protein